MSTELSLYGVNVINNSSSSLNTPTPSIFSLLPTELILKILSLVPFETGCSFAITNHEIYERIKNNIVIINKNKFSVTCGLIDQALSDVKYARVKIQIQEIVRSIQLKDFPSQLPILHSKLREEKLPFVNFLSSNIPLKDLKILKEAGSPMLEMAWIMGGMKQCLGFFDTNFNKESFNFGDNTPTWVHEWLLAAVDQCAIQEVEDIICWYLKIHLKMWRYHQACLYGESNEDFSDLPEAYFKTKPLFVSKDADECLGRFFARLIEKDQISIVASLFKNMGKLLLTHPMLNNKSFCFSLPQCIISLINKKNREKVKAYLNENLKLDPSVKDMFNMAIYIELYSKLLHKSASSIFIAIKEMKLSVPALENRALRCMLIDLPFKIIDTSNQTKITFLYHVGPKVLETIESEDFREELKETIEILKQPLKSYLF